MSSAPFPLFAYPLPENIREISKRDQNREQIRRTNICFTKESAESKMQQQFTKSIEEVKQKRTETEKNPAQVYEIIHFLARLFPWELSCVVIIQSDEVYFKLIHTHSLHTLAGESPNNVRWIIVSCFPFLTIKQHFQVRIDNTRISNRYNRFRLLRCCWPEQRH